MLNLVPTPDRHQHGGWKPTETPVTVYFSYAWLAWLAISHCVLTLYMIACSAGVFWVGETLFVFVILL